MSDVLRVNRGILPTTGAIASIPSFAVPLTAYNINRPRPTIIMSMKVIQKAHTAAKATAQSF